MKNFVISILYIICLAGGVAVAASAMPAWLAQVNEFKRQQPEAMLALMQEHQHELASLSAEHQAQWYYLQAVLFDTLGRHQQQQQAAEQGLRLVGDTAQLIRVKLLYELGFAREMQTDYASALQHYLSGLELATALESEKFILYGQINHAAVLTMRNEDQAALALLKDTYQRAMQLQDEEVLAEVNAELGLLYSSLGYDDEAIAMLNTAKQQYQKLNWPKSEITVLYNLARTYSYLDRYDQALETYNQMLQKSQQRQDYVNLYHAYLGLAVASISAGKSEAALAYINKAEEYLPQLESNAHIATHYYEKALIYKKLEQVSLAMQQVLLAEQSLGRGGLQDDKASQLALWHLKAQLLAAQGEYQRAYDQLYDFVYEYQQMRNQQNELAFERMRLGIDHERLQQKSRHLERENQLLTTELQQAVATQKMQRIGLGILGCLVALLALFVLWLRSHYKQQHQAANTVGHTG